MVKRNKIFKIDGDLFDVNLTVDSTLYTADTTLITADRTIENSYPYVMRVLPRKTTQEFTVTFLNELTQTTSVIDVLYFNYDGEHLQIYFNYNFKEGDSFEITITDNTITNTKRNLMWKGKGYATMQDDLEDYVLHTKNTNDVIIMD